MLMEAPRAGKSNNRGREGGPADVEMVEEDGEKVAITGKVGLILPRSPVDWGDECGDTSLRCVGCGCGELRWEGGEVRWEGGEVRWEGGEVKWEGGKVR